MTMCVMARFFFDWSDNKEVLIDHVGLEFPDAVAALSEARQALLEAAVHAPKVLPVNLHLRVRGSDGKCIEILEFKARKSTRYGQDGAFGME